MKKIQHKNKKRKATGKITFGSADNKKPLRSIPPRFYIIDDLDVQQVEQH